MAVDKDPRTRLVQGNRRAWDELYRDTPDLIWGRTPVGFLESFVRRIAERLDARSRLLDAACGEGRNLPLLARLPGSVEGCDASPHALAKAASWVEPSILLHACRLEAMPFDDATFDFILACDILETLPCPEQPLRELQRVLRPGGWLLCNIPDLDDEEVVGGGEMSGLGPREFLYRDRFYYHFMDEREAQRRLQDAGFRVLEQRRCRWQEAAHPGYREAPHQHTSQVYLVTPEIVD